MAAIYKINYALCFVLCTCVLSGCSFKMDEEPIKKETVALTNKYWIPKPVAVRIYPSTRFTVKENKPILEARVELFDEMGDSIKAAGWVSCELLEDIGPVGNGAGTQLYIWDVDLTSIHAQRLYYDPISRGYLLQLLLDENKISKKGAILKVVYTTAEGKRLIDQQNVR